MSGLEMLAEIRRRMQDTRVIVMTGEENGQLAVDALAAGADDFVLKPLSLVWLRTVLEMSLRREPPR
jgi:two-component system, OmpR family, response regulator TctD